MNRCSNSYKVTIITSIYNASAYMYDFLENIVDQTIFSECQLYLMNGNSPESDKEEEIIKKFSSYKNIKYAKLDKDPGIYGCWNKMIQDSNSEYITNANTDDTLLPDCIEKHVKLLDYYQNIDVAYCYNAIGCMSNHPYTMLGECKYIFPTAEFSLDHILQANLPHNHPVWRRSLHEKFGYFEDKKYISGSDWDFWLRCASGGVQMKLIPEVLGIYYQNPNGMSTKKENMARNIEEVQKIKNFYTGINK